MRSPHPVGFSSSAISDTELWIGLLAATELLFFRGDFQAFVFANTSQHGRYLALCAVFDLFIRITMSSI